MTRWKFLALCAGKKNHKGFKAYYKQFYGHRNTVAYRVYLDPGVGFPSGHAVIYTTADLAKAVDAENRFNMWLLQEKLHRDQLKAGGAA
jgi:hypothetical protein